MNPIYFQEMVDLLSKVQTGRASCRWAAHEIFNRGLSKEDDGRRLKGRDIPCVIFKGKAGPCDDTNCICD